MFMGCPLTWTSKLQTRIALSTMEAEYIALSQSMQELIAAQEILQEIQTFVIHTQGPSATFHAHAKKFKMEPIPTSRVYEDNEACLKFATMPKMSPRNKDHRPPVSFLLDESGRT